MLSKSILDQAKSFLGWDLYTNLTIKLIAIDRAVAFFHPPTTDLSTILIFYEKNCQDFSDAIFLLFHEAGHFEQFRKYQTNDCMKDFWNLIHLDKGEAKRQFERQAWFNGKLILEQFIEKYKLNHPNLIDQYLNYAEKCLNSYV